jgi:hypothetical protein
MTEEISFIDGSQKCCVYFYWYDRLGSVQFEITYPEKIKRYYSVFINTMAAISGSRSNELDYALLQNAI